MIMACFGALRNWIRIYKKKIRIGPHLVILISPSIGAHGYDHLVGIFSTMESLRNCHGILQNQTKSYVNLFSGFL